MKLTMIVCSGCNHHLFVNEEEEGLPNTCAWTSATHSIHYKLYKMGEVEMQVGIRGL